MSLFNRYDPEADMDRIAKYWKVSEQGVYTVRRKYFSFIEQRKARLAAADEVMSSAGEASFKKLHNSAFDIMTWLTSMECFMAEGLARVIFEGNAKTIKAHWTIKDFFNFACACLRGSKEDVFELAFRTFSKRKDVMSRADLVGMISLLLQHYTFRNPSPPALEEDGGGGIILSKRQADAFGFSWHDEVRSVDELADQVILEASTSGVSNCTSPGEEGRPGLTLPGFTFWLNLHPARSQHLNDLALISSCLMGVRPATMSQERAIIQTLVELHFGDHPLGKFCPSQDEGLQWYIISADWFQLWLSKTEPLVGDQLPNNVGLGLRRRVGPIDNRSLLSNGSSVVLRPGLVLGQDFNILPPLVWEALQSWYGGMLSISRRIRARKHFNRSRLSSSINFSAEDFDVELYPLCINVSLADKSGNAKPFQRSILVSRSESVSSFIKDLCKVISADFEKARLWSSTCLLPPPPRPPPSRPSRSFSNRPEPIPARPIAQSQREDIVLAHDMLFGDTNIKDGQELILEVLGEDGVWPRSRLPSAVQLEEESEAEETSSDEGNEKMAIDANSSSGEVEVSARGGTKSPTPGRISKAFKRRAAKGSREGENGGSDSFKPLTRAAGLGSGEVGLVNLGNTCYMNSMIQCLSHTPILSQYFTSKSYLNDINTANPMGHGGKLAQVFANLVIDLWSPNQKASSYITPRAFKNAIGKFNEMFAGNDQHDAQELLSFLLDGLSEDLNRIIKKPYIENPDSDGRPDSILADIWWKNHLQRELSIIVALFTGQFKGTTTCRKCGYESARYEPFMTLQLALPEDKLRTVSVFLTPFDGEKCPIRCSVRVKKDDTILQVLCELVMMFDLADGRESREVGNSGDEKIDSMVENERAEVIGSDSDTTGTSKKRKLTNGHVNGKADFLHSSFTPMSVNSEQDPEAKPTTPEEEQLSPFQLRVLELSKKYSAAEVVDNRIRKTIPATICVSDLNETGVLYVYELGIVGEKMEKEDGDGEGEEGGGKSETRQQQEELKHIAIGMRTLEKASSQYFLNPFRLVCFGTPILCRLPLHNMTGRQLYDYVATRFSRFKIKKDGHEELVYVGSEAVNSEMFDDDDDGAALHNTSELATDEKIAPMDSEAKHDAAFMKYDPLKHSHPTYTDDDTISGGDLPRHGFRLRVTSRLNGCVCSRCPWLNCCVGCLVPDDNNPLTVADGDSVAADFHITAMRENFDNAELSNIEIHRSIEDNEKLRNATITLDECIANFSAKEEVDEGYCSKCKTFHPMTKVMELWRLPPIMIIHLKRFQHSVSSRRKLKNLVTFSLDDQDFSSIVARARGESRVNDFEDYSGEVETRKDQEDRSILVEDKEEKKKEKAGFGGDAQDVVKGAEGGDRTSLEAENKEEVEGGEPRSDSGGDDEGEEDMKIDYENVNNLSASNGRDNSLYSLYGIVHHIGALSAGHYVSSVRDANDSSRWKLFNDEKIMIVQDVTKLVDHTAYCLFYVRKDVTKAQLNEFWQIGNNASDIDIENLLKERERGCSVS